MLLFLNGYYISKIVVYEIYVISYKLEISYTIPSSTQPMNDFCDVGGVWRVVEDKWAGQWSFTKKM
jgi:hypothetical protein